MKVFGKSAILPHQINNLAGCNNEAELVYMFNTYLCNYNYYAIVHWANPYSVSKITFEFWWNMTLYTYVNVEVVIL